MWKGGDRLGDRFRLEARVSAGGMGVVWRAHDEVSGGAIAVKLVASTDARDLERFRREVKVLAALPHPAIVAHVADGLTDDGGYFLAMEWIDGITVAQRLLGDGFSVAEAVALVRTVADALGVVHRAGIVHRDIKPSNVVLGGGHLDAIKVIDFGIARAPGAGATLTRTGTAIGTPGYMAPEQARGEKRLTPAADVFALGCLLHECATGRPTFSGTLPAAVLAKILVSHPPPLEVDCPEAPPALCRLVERMLAKRPEARPADADAVVAALDAIGAIADGPRRHTRSLTDDATVSWRSATASECCLILAARGEPGDELEPPTEAQAGALRRRLGELGASFEIMRTGAVIAMAVGPRVEVARCAARAALVLHEELDGWTVAVSRTTSDLAAAVDHGTELLAVSAIADLFAPAGGGAIRVDPETAPLLAGEFELDDGDPPRLRAPVLSSR